MFPFPTELKAIDKGSRECTCRQLLLTLTASVTGKRKVQLLSSSRSDTALYSADSTSTVSVLHCLQTRSGEGEVQHLPALVPLLKGVVRHQRCGRPRERRQIQVGHHLQSHLTRLSLALPHCSQRCIHHIHPKRHCWSGDASSTRRSHLHTVLSDACSTCTENSCAVAPCLQALQELTAAGCNVCVKVTCLSDQG